MVKSGSRGVRRSPAVGGGGGMPPPSAPSPLPAPNRRMAAAAAAVVPPETIFGRTGNAGGRNKTSHYYYRNSKRNDKLIRFSGKSSTSVSHERSANCLHNDHKGEILKKGYKLKAIIGSGSYAHVFRGKDVRTQREVAIKLIELDKCSQHYKDTCLRNEIYVIRELSHENIVKFYEAFNTPQAYVMVMEFVENGTFVDLLMQHGPVPEDGARKLFRGVFNGVDYMHRRLIAHRDLKLENLLLAKNFEPKITDFSLSVIWDGKTLLTDWCGTLPYFAPEILQKKPYDPLAYDVWSLGVCLYVMLNDNIPFACHDEEEMLYRQLNRDWRHKARCERTLSELLKNLVRSMLEPDPVQRIRIGQALRSLWWTTMNGAVVTATTTTTTTGNPNTMAPSVAPGEAIITMMATCPARTKSPRQQQHRQMETP